LTIPGAGAESAAAPPGNPPPPPPSLRGGGTRKPSGAQDLSPWIPACSGNERSWLVVSDPIEHEHALVDGRGRSGYRFSRRTAITASAAAMPVKKAPWAVE
jgi:hypothetical protein